MKKVSRKDEEQAVAYFREMLAPFAYAAQPGAHDKLIAEMRAGYKAARAKNRRKKKPKFKHPKTPQPYQTKFAIYANEGSFFDEDWLVEEATKQQYRYDKVPKPVQVRFVQAVRAAGRMTPQEAAMIIGWIEFQK